MKKLPKAIRITGDNAGEAEALFIPVKSVTAPPDQPHDKSGAATGPILAEGVVQPPAPEPLPLQTPAPAPEAAMAVGASDIPMPPAGANSTHALVRVGADKVGRRWRARAIVERHANYSAIGGVIPLPIVNIAGVTVIILRMVKSLSNLYGVPFERNRARAIITGMIGGLTPAVLSTMTASSLLFIVPGSNLLGLAVSSVTASACTRRIGSIFIDHFESGATLLDFPLPAKR